MKPIIQKMAAGCMLVAATAAQADPQSAVFLVVENGGVVTDREAAKVTIDFVLGEIVKLRRRRATRDTEIHIVLTANPTEVTWSGTAQQLFEQGQTVMDMIEFKDTCSDLSLAWDQVKLTTRITMPDEYQLIAIGPMIHAGFPCDEGDTTISLPQDVPKDLMLGELASAASVVRLLNVHADQDEVYLDYLRDVGLVERARNGEVDFDLMDAARTRAAHGNIMGGQ